VDIVAEAAVETDVAVNAETIVVETDEEAAVDIVAEAAVETDVAVNAETIVVETDEEAAVDTVAEAAVETDVVVNAETIVVETVEGIDVEAPVETAGDSSAVITAVMNDVEEEMTTAPRVVNTKVAMIEDHNAVIHENPVVGVPKTSVGHVVAEIRRGVFI